ncbi:MAG: DUF1697 domain-containing protein [Spirochaetaceae bacterium]|jgi:uncharacterized protein (DUF1697 family)|nr:DUF1697 domain-containing protein [Spirochaetaceae bacterium]
MERRRYLALLRGINVGGNNIIKMDALKNLFEEAGFTGAATYIQSGNVMFTAAENSKTKIAEKMETALYKKLGNKITAALLTFPELKRIIEKKPKDFGEEADTYKYDVIFLIEPLRARDAAGELRTREGVDEKYEGEQVLYIRRLTSSLSKSYFSKVALSSIYPNITIRNWNTTKKLFEIMDA